MVVPAHLHTRVHLLDRVPRHDIGQQESSLADMITIADLNAHLGGFPNSHLCDERA
jgi:hypothetical protein